MVEHVRYPGCGKCVERLCFLAIFCDFVLVCFAIVESSCVKIRLFAAPGRNIEMRRVFQKEL